MTLEQIFPSSPSTDPSSSPSFVYPSPLNDSIQSFHLISHQQQQQEQELSLPHLLWGTPLIPMEDIHSNYSNFDSLFDTTTTDTTATNNIYPSPDTTSIDLYTNTTMINHFIPQDNNSNNNNNNNNNKFLSFNSLSQFNISDAHNNNNINLSQTPSPPSTRVAKLVNDAHYRLNQANLRQQSNCNSISNLSLFSSSPYYLQRPNSPDLTISSSTYISSSPSSSSSSSSSQFISSPLYLPPPLSSFLLAN